MTSYQVDRKRWAAMTLIEQMGNIYSEVGRSLRAQRDGDDEQFQNALIRALDLFDATVESTLTHKPFRAKEILRAKDQYLRLFFGNDAEPVDPEGVERYFYHFAVAARNGR